MNWFVYLDGFFVILMLSTATWLFSLYIRDVSIVDSVWSLMFLAACIVFILQAPDITTRSALIFIMVSIWATRLFLHITWRSWGIFVFQAILAWVITLPLFTAFNAPADYIALDVLAILLWLTGMSFETISDWQLVRFKSNPDNKGKVMNMGLWRYSRHPNYFGECLVWWGFYCFALNSGGWWSIISPLLITWLLLKFSGVVMLEETITKRRPAYSNYIKTTNAFIPGPVKHMTTNVSGEEHA